MMAASGCRRFERVGALKARDVGMNELGEIKALTFTVLKYCFNIRKVPVLFKTYYVPADKV